MSLTYQELTPQQKLYFFEFLLAEAVRSVLEDNEVRAYTQFTPFDFQKDRPRAEIIFIPGIGNQIFYPISDTVARESAWKGNYIIDCITAAENLIHAAFVVKVRSIMHGIGEAVNEVKPTMEFHRIKPWFRDAGTSVVSKPEEDYYQSTLSFEIDYSIQSDGWALLNQ